MKPRHIEMSVIDVGQGRLSLKPGDTVLVGRKWWGVCGRCTGLVRIDKPFLGDLHYCPDRD